MEVNGEFAPFSDDDFEKMPRYLSPVNPHIYPYFTYLLLSFAIFFTSYFFIYEVSTPKETRSFLKELGLSFAAALFAGFGVLFLLLSVGIYV